MNDTTKLILILAIIAGGGGIAYYFYQKNQKEKAAIPAANGAGNPNAASKTNKTADTIAASAALISAGIGAYNAYTDKGSV